MRGEKRESRRRNLQTTKNTLSFRHERMYINRYKALLVDERGMPIVEREEEYTQSHKTRRDEKRDVCDIKAREKR